MNAVRIPEVCIGQKRILMGKGTQGRCLGRRQSLLRWKRYLLNYGYHTSGGVGDDFR
jgi:hypothetical protein